MHVEPPATLGAPVMTGGKSEGHPEPQVMGDPPAPAASFRVVKAVESEGEQSFPAQVLYEGGDLIAARAAYNNADPGVGYVQLFQHGEVVDTRRADPDPEAEGAAEATIKGPDITINLDEETIEEAFERQRGVIEDKVRTVIENTGQATAFDPAPFTSKRPEIDGETADKIKITLTGTWELDPMIEDDVALFNRLHLGQSLDLQIEGEVVAKQGSLVRGESGDTITGAAKVQILHVHRLTAEQL
jgi:hypothetical protein